MRERDTCGVSLLLYLLFMKLFYRLLHRQKKIRTTQLKTYRIYWNVTIFVMV